MQNFKMKVFWCVYHIDRIEKISDGHADRTADSAVNTAENQRTEHTDSVSEMDRGGISAWQPDF